MKWKDSYPRLKYSLLELIVQRSIFDVSKPYAHPTNTQVIGTGVIVDIVRGLVLTTAETVKDAGHIGARSYLVGREQLEVKLLSICLNRNVALCQLSAASVKELTVGAGVPEIFNMLLGDNLKLSEGHKMLMMNWKEATPVNFVGYQVQDGSSHFVVDHSLDVGGVVVNQNQEMVGLVRPGTNLVIGSRTILCVYDMLISGKTDVVAPTFSFDYNHTTAAMMEHLTGNSNFGGVYVNAVNGDSAFNKLNRRDVISQLVYRSPFWFCPRLSFAVTDLGKDRVLLSKTTELIACDIDNYGDVVVRVHDKKDKKDGDDRLVDRRISLEELQDNIPTGSDIPTSVWRKGKWTPLEGECYIERNEYYRRYMQYTIHPRTYEVVGGMVLTPLDSNHRDLPNIDPFYFSPEESSTRYLVVTEVLPGTTLADVGSIQSGDILYTVNSKEVSTLKDLAEVINSSGKYVIFRTMKSKCFIVTRETMNREDKKALLNNNIDDSGRIRR